VIEPFQDMARLCMSESKVILYVYRKIDLTQDFVNIE